MKLFKKLTTGLSALALMLAVVAANGGVASAACYQYTGQTMSTSSVPVFNNICGVPGSIGDEADFVRVRPSVSGGVSNANASTNALYTNSLSSACTDHQKFDVRSYIHNDAEPQYNSGAGTGIAHNVALHNNAPLNTTASSFTFSSQITANNASPVSDTASISCSNGAFTLKLVPGSSRYYSEVTKVWTTLGDSTATGATTISSDPASPGNVPGCWDFRVLVGYTVEVTRNTTPPAQSGTCDLMTISVVGDRTVAIDQLNNTMNNVTMNKVVINWGDGQTDTFTSLAAAKAATHTYPKTSTVKIYVINAVMTFTGTNGTFTAGGIGCTQAVKYTPQHGTTKVTETPPSTLVNTGAGSTIAMFSAVTAAGALAHRYFLSRKLGRQ